MRNPKITLVRSKTKLIKYKTLCFQKWTLFRIFTPAQYFAFFSVNALFKSKEKVIFVISSSRRIRIHMLKRKRKFVETLHYWHLTYSRIGQCVRPSGRLNDNFWKANPIVMKFCTQHYLNNISLEFEDENNSSRIYWVTARNIIIFYMYSLLCNDLRSFTTQLRPS
jgi:hypothetical protein